LIVGAYFIRLIATNGNDTRASLIEKTNSLESLHEFIVLADTPENLDRRLAGIAKKFQKNSNNILANQLTNFKAELLNAEENGKLYFRPSILVTAEIGGQRYDIAETTGERYINNGQLLPSIRFTAFEPCKLDV
jgi:hypothetical protein